MRLAALTLTAFIVAGCSSQPAVQQSDNSLRRKFESAIAREILSEVRQELRLLKGSTRAVYLQSKSKQFEGSVDLTQVTSKIQLEHQLLEFLTRSESIKWQGGDFLAKVQALSSLNWSLNDYESRVLTEIDRLDQTIATIAAYDPLTGFSLANHVQEVRETAEYPEDSHLGRQRYLDSLTKAMIGTQLDWHEFFTRYEASDLGITGTESAETTFNHSRGMLHISLAEVTDLPLFELRSIAAYYGFPGLQSFYAQTEDDSLSAALDLPGYTLGWAGYVLDFMATREVSRTLSHLYFSRLMAGLALADLRINSGIWTIEEAAAYVFSSTPYSANRIRLMLSKTGYAPGRYLAATAGKLKFSALRSRCPAEQERELHQRIVEIGPLPFPLLERRLSALNLIEDQ